MLSTDTFQLQKRQCIRHSAFENLSVIPYVKGRLVFSELAVRALEEGDYDLIIADLPYFMNTGHWLDLPLGLFPHVSALVVPRGDGSLFSCPFVPNDAACAALSVGRRLREAGFPTEVRCIDDSQVINYPADCVHQPKMRLPDDYLVFVEGLEGYYRPVFHELDRLWGGLSSVQQLFLDYRARVIAERLRSFLRVGSNTLLVCEYRLWWRLSKMLDGQFSPQREHFFTKWEDLKAALVVGDSYLFWANGLLDDHPAVVARFWERLDQGLLRTFDKLREVDGIITGLIDNRDRKKAGSPSVRRVASFARYLKARLLLERRVTPSLVSHVYDAAYACLGKHCADDMVRELLKYPQPNAEGIMKYFDIQPEQVVELTEGFGIPDLSRIGFYTTATDEEPTDILEYHPASGEQRMELINRILSRFSRKELEHLDHRGWVKWAIEEDYRLHEIACGQTRRILAEKGTAVIKRKSSGTLGGRIHWKATLAARARGENTTYLRVKERSAERDAEGLDDFTPVVFLFRASIADRYSGVIADYNITKRLAALDRQDIQRQELPPPDEVLTVFYTYSGDEYLYDGHVSRAKLGSLTLLYTGRVMGLERYRRVTGRPERYQCRTRPTDDPEIRDFPLSDMGIAWAVKYASDRVLVVAEHGWRPSIRLDLFARSRKVRIVPVSVSAFSVDFIERLKTIYFTSTSLKKHPDRETILARVI